MNDLGYCEPVDIVLRRHEGLRHIYEEAKTGHQYERGSNAKLLSLGQWHGLLEATELYDPGFSARERALLLLLAHDGHQLEQRQGARMEAGCRLRPSRPWPRRQLQALPTDEDEAGQSLYSDAGQFMADFRLTEAYNDLLRERSRDWGDDPQALPAALPMRGARRVHAGRALQDKTARRKAGFLELGEGRAALGDASLEAGGRLITDDEFIYACAVTGNSRILYNTKLT